MIFTEQLHALVAQANAAISSTQNAEELFRIEKRFLGRRGAITTFLKTLQNLPAAERPNAGGQANRAKNDLEHALQAKRTEFSRSDRSGDDALTLSLPGVLPKSGTRHPLMSMQDAIVDIFRTMGYDVLYGPEIELAKYNFDLLRIPENHPARDVWDTFYVESDKKLSGPGVPLLRTHISPMQIRIMEKREPPIRFISPGRVFRHEATDATHEANYFYCEGMAIDRGITFGHLLGTLEAFFKTLFGPEAEIRAQPSYFPFVEPGAEILMKGEHGWMEMLGCGMIHPEVLRNMRVNPKEYSGFAFGIGIDRLMLYYNHVPDIRLSYQGDLRFLEQFPL